MRRVVPEQWELFRDFLGGVSREDYVATWLELDEHGYRPKEELYSVLVSQFGFSAAAEELFQDFRRRYEACFVAMPFARETLAELRTAGIRLGVVTNGRTEVQSAKIRGLGFEFDAVLISEAEGLRKPDPAIFYRAADRLGVRVDECAFVGDHPQADVAGSAAAGMRAVWLENDIWPAPPLATRRISCLSELTQHL